MPTELWTAAECAAYHHIGGGDPARTWRSYSSRGYAPKPIDHKGRTPLWDAEEIRTWTRPGRGARTDLKETATMAPVAPAEPLTRAVYGRELRIGNRAFLAMHVDGYAYIDVLTRREPRFESRRDDDRPAEWVQVERYTTLDITFDDPARRRFDAWVDGELRSDLEAQPGKYLRTY